MKLLEILLWHPEITVPLCFVIAVTALSFARASRVIEQVEIEQWDRFVAAFKETEQ